MSGTAQGQAVWTVIENFVVSGVASYLFCYVLQARGQSVQLSLIMSGKRETQFLYQRTALWSQAAQ